MEIIVARVSGPVGEQAKKTKRSDQVSGSSASVASSLPGEELVRAEAVGDVSEGVSNSESLSREKSRELIWRQLE